jgi:hypothetical protein
MVGMRRPKICKVEMVETTLEEGDEVDYDTGITGEQHLTLDGAISAARLPRRRMCSPLLCAQSKLDAATDVFLEAEVKADALMQITTDTKKRKRSRSASMTRRCGDLT